MASWDELVSYVRMRYEVMRHDDDEVWFRLPTRGDRTQLVALRHLTGDDEHPWAMITSPVARVADVDLTRLLELAGESVLGGAVIEGGVVEFRHSVPLGETLVAGFERAFHVVVDVADRLEETFTGRDRH